MPAHNYTNKSNILGNTLHWYLIVAVLLPFYGVIINKIWRFRSERLILWWSSTVSSKKLVSEIESFLITIVTMMSVLTGVSIVLCICSGLGLGNYGAAWWYYCCYYFMMKYNTKVNYRLYHPTCTPKHWLLDLWWQFCVISK